jgi:hypothetical protein
VSTIVAARRSRPKIENVPVCIRYQHQSVRAVVAAAVAFGGAETVAAARRNSSASLTWTFLLGEANRKVHRRRKSPAGTAALW